MTKIDKRPWGREHVLEHNDMYTLKILEIDVNQRTSLQYHVHKRETMYCLYGKGYLIVVIEGIDHRTILCPGQYITIDPGTIHRLEASDESPLIILEASSPELDDVVRLRDDYGRIV